MSRGQLQPISLLRTEGMIRISLNFTAGLLSNNLVQRDTLRRTGERREECGVAHLRL